MKTKKVIDWIRFQNIRDNSRNFTALKGLSRVNKILSFLLKYGIASCFLAAGIIWYKKDLYYVLNKGPKDFLNKLNDLPNKEEIYMKAHKNLLIDFLSDEVINIYYK
jgi:hypothetical protein